MKEHSALSMARKIMTEFARQTGISPPAQFPRRYLWTDAFAVCNFLELYRQTGDDQFKSLALQLVDQVHNQLGRHREDDPRTGWISGLGEADGKLHPTSGGLRIGKKMNERDPAEPFDQNLEWDRDGQYYHYLIKWMHALNQVSKVIADPVYNLWARELARAIHSRFIFTLSTAGQKGLYWKMSIDLSRPLVPSMGHHDPLEGFITFQQLQATPATDSKKAQSVDLSQEICELAEICEGKSWVTDDSLGLGGLMSDAYQVAQMISTGNFDKPELLETLLDDSLQGLVSFANMKPLNLPANYRLAFRELGLAIGIHAIKRIQELIEKKPQYFKNRNTLAICLEQLLQYEQFMKDIENFWLESCNQEADTWLEHLDINRVMLATSLVPDGFFGR